MRLFVLFFYCILFYVTNLAQNKEFDRLEMLYDQQHFKLVYKKATKFLDNPAYDFSLIPLYYKTLCTFQLAHNEFWLNRNPEVLEEAKINFKKIKNTSDGAKIFNAHFYEIVGFKRDLMNWLEDLKLANEGDLFDFVQNFIAENLSEYPDIEDEIERNFIYDAKDNNSIESPSEKKQREKLIELALKQQGVPYSFSGTTPKGFDCSGFTSYAHSGIEKKIPRSAREQFEKGKKIKEKELKKGDLIFFSNGNYISHVGIIISNKDGELVMVHASSTQGIVVTDVKKSKYWLKKIAGFATYF